jgi:hypothetical protein
MKQKNIRDFRILQCKWGLRPLGMLHRVDWRLHRRFGTNYWYHFQGLIVLEKMFLDCLTLEDSKDMLRRNVGI